MSEVYDIREARAEIERLRAQLEVANAGYLSAVNHARWQASTNRELNDLEGEVERLRGELARIKAQASDATEYVLARINRDVRDENERLRSERDVAIANGVAGAEAWLAERDRLLEQVAELTAQRDVAEANVARLQARWDARPLSAAVQPDDADKALRFDFDRAGIEQREAEAIELVELRAEVQRLRGLLREWLRSIPNPADQQPAPQPEAVRPMAWLGFPDGEHPKHDVVYDGTRKLDGYRYTPLWRPEDHPSAQREAAKADRTADQHGDVP